MQTEQPQDSAEAAAIREAIRVTPEELKELGDLCAGRNLGRNSSVQLAAIRTKLEYSLARPAQEHALSGSVTIVVASPLPGRIGAGRAKGLPVATSEQESAPFRQGPITVNMSTENSAETQAISEAAESASTELVIEDGRLRASETMTLDAEQRRAREREAWLADTDVHPPDEAA